MIMNVKLKDLPGKSKLHPIFKDLPDELKNHDKFIEIEKRLGQITLSSHKHKNVSSYVKCDECKGKIQEKQDAIKALGFTSFAQYMEWKKVMVIIQTGGIIL